MYAPPGPDFDIQVFYGDVSKLRIHDEGLVVCPNIALRGLLGDLRRKCNGPSFVIYDDIHRQPEHADAMHQFLEPLATGAADYILTPYTLSRPTTGYPYQYVPKVVFDRKFVFFPHCAPSYDSSRYLAQVKVKAAVLAGAIDMVYPYRQAILLGRSPNIVRLEPGRFVRTAFLDELARYDIGITCNSWLDYVVAKYYEIPWTGGILIAHPPNNPELARILGFEHGTNVIFEPDPYKVPGEVSRLLSPEAAHEAESIRVAGYKLVNSRHTATHRLAYLKRLVDAVRLGHNFTPDDAYGIFA
jgi:hypothetical protein